MIRQLYNQVRTAILSGRLQPETRLPSSRDLAGQLQISRNVVLEAFDLLHAEGFLQSRRGAGTFVADGAIFSKRVVDVEAPEVEKVTMGYDCPKGVINFRAGTPNLKLFPQNLWQKMIKKVFAKPLEETLAYGHPEGRVELRQAICEYVVTQREVMCHPDQIVITAGTTQAIGIACHLLLSKEEGCLFGGSHYQGYSTDHRRPRWSVTSDRSGQPWNEHQRTSQIACSCLYLCDPFTSVPDRRNPAHSKTHRSTELCRKDRMLHHRR